MNTSSPLLIAAIVLLVIPTLAHAEEPAFKIVGDRIEISRYSEASAKVLEERKKSSPLVRLMPPCTQEDFAKVCQHGWIKNLEIGFVDPFAFDLRERQIGSLEPVANLKGLTRLGANALVKSKENPVSLQPLAGLTNLEEIRFHSTRLKDFVALESLSKLKTCSIKMCALPTLEFLRKTSAVEDLELVGPLNTFESFEPLLALPKLRRLRVSGNNVTDESLAPLSGIRSLEEFEVQSRHITHLNFLAGSKGLRRIRASFCKKLTDCSVLKDMNGLEDVALWAPVDDLSFLKGKDRITRLELRTIKIDDLPLISGLKSLRTFKATKALVPGGTPEKLRETHPDLSVTLFSPE